MIKSESLKKSVQSYLDSLSLGSCGRYKSSTFGQETLYASCFALMIKYYLGEFDRMEEQDKKAWSEYILSYQDQTTGYFFGPELVEGNLLSEAHSRDHLLMHLTAHVLPCLKILGVKPLYELRFAKKLMDKEHLNNYLAGIDWTNAWIEGNNLLFVGQILVYFLEEFNEPGAMEALDILFNCLNQEIDQETGLWGTQSGVGVDTAIYGAYHQFILYFYLEKEIQLKEKIIDSVLSIQRFDGGFTRYLGGGSCEDIDSVFILVNLYKDLNYKRPKIENSLRKAALNIIRKLTKEGGFYYKRDSEFYHMGIQYTYAPAGVANLFSTWFSLHTLFLISEIIELPCTQNIDYRFNNSCSMGWGQMLDEQKKYFYNYDYINVIFGHYLYKLYCLGSDLKRRNVYLDNAYKKIRGIYGNG